MCLDLRTKYKKPYNRSKIRYKVFRLKETKHRAQHFKSLWEGGNYVRGRFYRARNTRGPCDWDGLNSGFHCFVTKFNAIKLARHKTGGRDMAVVKLRVRRFLASGKFSYNNRHFGRTETWKEMRIVKLIKIV